MLLELSDPPHLITPKGKGWANWLIDYGPNADVIWGVILDESGEIWWVSNDKVRVSGNWSRGQETNDD